MDNTYQSITKEISQYVGKLHKEIPNVMQGFSKMASAATANHALEPKTKELLALGIAISTRCDGCIGFHSKKLVELGTSRDEFLETLAMAIYMGGGPSLMYAAHALKAFEEFSNT